MRTHLRALFAGAVALSLTVPVASGALAGGHDFEGWDDRKASEILPAEMLSGPQYRIDERVISLGYQNVYTVQSDYGTFEAQGDAMLRRLLREIYAVSELKKISQSEAFGAALKQAALSPVEGVKSLITDPVDTVSGVPEGIFSIFSRASEALKVNQSEYEDGAAKALLSVSSFKRDYAKALGVDVYSSNPVLQEELNRLGWAGAVGNLTPGAATLPFSGPAVLALSSANYVNRLNDLITELPPAELSQRNRETLTNMGIEEGLTNRFLDHPIYSPRHETIIVESLAALEGAKGRGRLLEQAVVAQSEPEALFFQQVAETIAGYHRTVAPVLEVGNFDVLPVAYAGNRSLVVAFPGDYGRWTPRSAPIVKALVDGAKEKPIDKVEVWITGTFSDRAKEKFGAMGLVLVEDVDQKVGMMD